MKVLEQRILSRLQQGFPICAEPFNVLARELGISEELIISEVKRLTAQGIIRRLAPLFNTNALGYASTLMTMKVPTERIEEVASLVNEYYQVTHNYQRDDEYNLWFTVIASSDEELERIMAQIKESTGIKELLNLPTRRIFKIEAVFQLGEGEEDGA